MRFTATLLAFALLTPAALAQRGTPPSASSAPARPGVDLSRFSHIDAAVAEALTSKKLPGAVVLVGHRDAVVFRKSYGQRASVPAAEPMTADTIFDLASLTKVVATTTAVMMLVEDGTLRLNDTVASFIPDFGRYNKARITLRDLLTHMSGLRPDVDLGPPWTGHDEAIRLAVEEVPTAEPGRRFVYSDINFFLLAEVVAIAARQPFDQFVQARIFGPLGMRDTTFNPPAARRPLIAPTQRCTPLGDTCEGPQATMLRGVVHDPTARRMGGVAGHAGLFSTASDLAIFCRMLLNGGVVGGRRVLSPLTVARMIAPASPATEPNVRGLGWDLDSTYSSNRGEFLPLGSFGHTGFTGTSLWIDPATSTFVVFLSNRVHPDGTGDVTPLRARVASIAASALTDITLADAQRLAWPRVSQLAPATATPAVQAPLTPVLTGIDVLRAENFASLKGLRLGLLTNHTGLSRDGVPTIDLLAKAPGVTLVSLLSPEHGIRGILDVAVPSSKDEKTGLVIHSLYGQTQRPTAAMLDGIDAVVIDLQDVGARFYTYMTTMAYVMEEAAPRKIKVIVLDRPNPIGGVEIEGPALDASGRGHTGYFLPMPIRNGMTMGELAQLFNAENKIGADLRVVAMKGWRRDAWYDETGLSWINPSPNMRNLYQATLYPGVGAFEATNISVGRGTDTPFEHIGAPWIDGPRLADRLNARRIPGARFYPVTFTPTTSKFAGEVCQGVFIVVTDRVALKPVRLGVEIATALHALHGATFQAESAGRLFGSAAGVARIRAGDDPVAIASSWSTAEARWRLLRAKYLLY